MPSLHRRGKRSLDGTMTLMEHLYELRRRLFLAVMALFLGSVIGFVWYSVGIPAIRLQPLGEILIAPYCAVPAPPRVIFPDAPCGLLATTPFSILQVRLKAAIMAGALLSCPFWLYQLWSFVTPALYSRERKFAVIFVSCAATLFAAGVVIAYIVIPHGLQVLLGFGGDTASAALEPNDYYSFLIGVLLVFGVSLELPLLLVMLNFAGVVKGVKLAKVRRYAIFTMVVFAAFVVPGNDPITMSALAVVLAVLYEVATQIAKIHDKRKAERAVTEGFAGLSDDEASPSPVSASTLGADGLPDSAQDVGAPESVEQAEPLVAAEAVASSPPGHSADLGDAT